DACVDDAGDLADFAKDLVGDLPVAVDICAIDLDIDRRRQPEIQDLRHHVGGQEGEGDGRELAGQIRAQPPHIVGGGMMVLFEGNHDVRVACTDEAGGGVHEIDAAEGQPDVVENVVRLACWEVTADG